MRRNAALRRSPVVSEASTATLGILVGLSADGDAFIDLPQSGRRNVPARSTVALVSEQLGRDVLVTWVDDDRDHPIITGVIRKPTDGKREAAAPRVEAVIDAERIVLTGRREVVLRCGKASILLSADGSVVIKGARLLSSASGVQRIRGGAVQIN